MSQESDRLRLARFYAEMTSLETILAELGAEGLDPDRICAADLYTRGFDCHNLGGFPQLEATAAAVERIAAPRPGELVLDLGCGIGGPGRYLADRFGCRVVGVDLLPVRIDAARALAERARCERVEYHLGDATALGFGAASFAQVWILDASIHIRDKRALFGEIARVLRPGGMLVFHDQIGPLPRAMLPLIRRSPWVAPPLPALIRRIEEAGLRLLLLQDTTPRVREFFHRIQQRMQGVALPALLEAYLTTLDGAAGRTGLLLAQRRDSATGPRRDERPGAGAPPASAG